MLTAGCGIIIRFTVLKAHSGNNVEGLGEQLTGRREIYMDILVIIEEGTGSE